MPIQKGPTFLIADDEPSMRALLSRMLQSGFPGSSVIEVSDPNRVPELAAGIRPQLILLDWIFPGSVTGAAICQKIKRHPQTRMIPIILMSGQRKMLKDRVQSVHEGADLFLAKPATSEELCGYVRALLDRSKILAQPLRVGSLTLSHSDHCGWWKGEPIPTLTPKQFEMLWLLARKSPRPVTFREFVLHIWNNSVRDKHVTLAMLRLRKKLESLGKLSIEPVTGIGYRLMMR